jgi:hypothetical protein
MQPVVPSWFKQRQAKAEPAGDNLYRLTGPIMPETFITIRQADNGLWQGVLLQTPTGPELAVSPAECETPADAWQAAFELHRVHIVV